MYIQTLHSPGDKVFTFDRKAETVQRVTLYSVTVHKEGDKNIATYTDTLGNNWAESQLNATADHWFRALRLEELEQERDRYVPVE